MKNIKLLIILLLSSVTLSSQVWLDPFFNRDNVKLEEIQDYAEAYFSTIDIDAKGSGYKQYKRFEWFWKDRLMPDGTFPTSDFLLKAKQNINQESKENKVQASLEWEFLGPNSSTGGYSGMGRVNCVRKNPHDGTLWAGTPAGGIWVSSNNGTSWFTNTDDENAITSLGVTSIAFHPSNPSIVYIASGDGDGQNTYSLGVLKSLDGGQSWETTGLSWNITQFRTISKIVIHPTDPEIVYSAGSNGINKTTDGGTTWTNVKPGNFKDLELKPGTPSTIYAAGSSFWKSTDNGQSWSQLSNGIPTTGNRRIALAVSKNNPKVIYSVIGNSSGNNLKGVYLSSNSGDSFTQIAGSTPNMMGYKKDGDDTKGQTGYDLCIEIDQDNWQKAIIGGINTWRTTNAGSDWEISSMWTGNHSDVSTVHADQHDLWYDDINNTLFLGNDGGVYSSVDFGDNWSWIGSGILATQFYKFGISQLDSSVYIGGTQDNGTKVHRSNGTWRDAIGGDGFESIVDFMNPNIMYGSIYFGEFFKSNNGGNNFRRINDKDNNNVYDDLNQGGAWSTPLIINPDNNQTLLIGLIDVWISNDATDSFKKISNFGFGDNKLVHLAIAPSDTNVIYAAFNSRIYKTTNYGLSWEQMTRPGSSGISYVFVDENDSDKLWATNSGYSGNNKIFESTDGGNTWTSLLKNLQNIPVLSVIKQKGTNDRLWIGTDIGVFYTDDDMNEWKSYNPGLPNVIVTEIEINYTYNQIFASTYGRGIWKADLPTTLERPLISEPINNSFGIKTSNLLVDWNDIEDATKYIVQSSNDNNFDDNVSTDTVTVSRYILASLEYFTQFFIRVKALSDFSQSEWSSINKFTTIVNRVSLISPINNSIGKDTNELLKWAKTDGATEYQLQLSEDSEFSEILLDTNLNDLQLATSNLKYFSEYWFKVRAKDPSGSYGDWSFVRKFKTNINSPLLVLPENLSNLIEYNYSFDWMDVNNADNYIIQIATDDEFENIYIESSTSNSSIAITNLSPFTNYFWKVKAENNGIGSNWSEIFTFTSKIEQLTIVSPINNSINQDTNSIFDWNDVDYADIYEFQLDLVNTFDSGNFYKSNLIENTINRIDLLFDTVYYSRVRVKANNQFGEWSEINNFRTELAYPILISPTNETENFQLDSKFIWENRAGKSESRIQVSNDANFDNNIEDKLLSVSEFVSDEIEYNKKYYWRVRAERDDYISNWSEIFTYNTPITDDKPFLDYPSNNQLNLSIINLNLKWLGLNNVSNYTLQVSNNIEFNNPILYNNEVNSTNFDFKDIEYNKSYYWRVKGNRENNDTEWSDIWKFSTTLPEPMLELPLNSSTSIELTNKLEWSEIDGASIYNIEVSESNQFLENIDEMTKSIKDNTLGFSGLENEKTYYWRVNAENNTATSEWSDIWKFTTSEIVSFISTIRDYGTVKITPNPFDDYTNIEISSVINSDALITVTDLNGRLIKEIANKVFVANQIYSFKFYKERLSSGTYFLNINLNGRTKSLKMIVN